MKHMTRAATAVLVLLAARGSDAAQPSAPPSPSAGAVRESAGAVLIEIPVNVVGKDGKPGDGRARPAELPVARQSDAERGGGRKLLLAFKPEGLAPGRYALKVAVTDPASKATAEAASVFVVR